MSTEKKQHDPNSLSQFVENKFNTLEVEKLNKFKAIALLIDSLGNDGLSLTANEAYGIYLQEQHFLDLTVSDFSVFLSNSFIYKWLNNKVFELQRPLLRKIIMGLSDSNMTPQEIKAIDSFKSMLETNDTISDGVTYVYVKTNYRKAGSEDTDRLIQNYVTEVK